MTEQAAERPSSDGEGEAPGDLAKQALHPRVANHRLRAAHDYLCHLELAVRSARTLGYDLGNLQKEISRVTAEIPRLERRKGERIEPRRRVEYRRRTLRDAPRPQFHLYLDECGSHHLGQPGDDFPVFVLCGVIVDADAYPAFDRHWKTWKATRLGSPDIRVHEPNVRNRSYDFHRSDPVEQADLLLSLDPELSELAFDVIAAAIDKRAFFQTHGNNPVDDFLPRSAYLMCVDFLIERFVHYLYYRGGDAQGQVFAESRGSREDAEVHAEFIRLLLEGTQWQADGWFRYQLRPSIEFLPKSRNVSGLQIADLGARPIAEKILQPDSTPERWLLFRSRLYDGVEGRPASYGLKVYPIPETDICMR